MNDLVKYFAKNNMYTHWRMRLLRQWDRCSDQQLLDSYNQAFLTLFKKAFSSSPFYTRLYREHGIAPDSIRSLADLSRLPVITKEMIRDHVDDLYNGSSFLKTKNKTSGTTGSPIFLYRTLFDISSEQAYIRHYRERMGFHWGQPLLSIRGDLFKSNAPYYHFKPANILYLSSPNINANTIEMYHRLIQKFRPVAIEAYPSYLHKFVMELRNKNLDLKIPRCFTSSEMMMEYQREHIEPYLNTRIYDWYGTAERNALLVENEEGQYKPMPLYALHEFKDGQVLGTNLINTRFPLIRYQLTDVVRVRDQGFEKNLLDPDVLSIEGRASDVIYLQDGSVLGCIDGIFKGVPHLLNAQVHQYGTDAPVIIKLVTTPQFGPEQEMQLRNNILTRTGETIDLRFTYCNKEDLTLTSAGKFKLIIHENPEGR